MYFPVIESMTKFKIGPWTVRIWRSQTEVREAYDNRDLVDWVASQTALRVPSHQEIVDGLANFDRVSAIEILDSEGNGALGYCQWP